MFGLETSWDEMHPFLILRMGGPVPHLVERDGTSPVFCLVRMMRVL